MTKDATLDIISLIGFECRKQARSCVVKATNKVPNLALRLRPTVGKLGEHLVMPRLGHFHSPIPSRTREVLYEVAKRAVVQFPAGLANCVLRVGLALGHVETVNVMYTAKPAD